MKAISTIIAAILLVVITIGLVSTAYLFASGVLTGQISKTISLIHAKGHRVTVRNAGTKEIEADEIKIDVNGQEAEIVNPQAIGPDNVVTLKFAPPEFGNELKSAKVNIIGSTNTLSYTTNIIPHELKVTPDTVGLWHFDEVRSNKTYDNSENNNNGNFSGESFNDGILKNYTGSCGGEACPSWTTGRFGSALEFDGIGDYVEVPDSSSYDYFTLEAWVKFDSVGGNTDQAIFSKQDGTGPCPPICGRTWLFSHTDGKIRSYIGGDSTETDFTPTVGEWNHYALTYNDGKIKIYVNGIDRTIPPNSFTEEDATGNFIIGNHKTQPTQFMNGTIDEIRIYNRTLTEDEIKADMQSSRPVNRPVAALSFEEGSGQFANDTHIWVKGKFDSALSFDGIDDYVDAGNDTSLVITNEITVEAWVKGNTQPSGNYNEHLVAKQNSYVLDWDHDAPSANTTFWTNFMGMPWPNAGPIPNPSADEWYHLAGVYNGSYLILYVDGSEATRYYVGTQTILPTTYNLTIGASGTGTCWFNGTIDEVAIYDRALTQEEILDSIYG